MGLGQSKSSAAKKKRRDDARNQVSDKDRTILDLKNSRDRLRRVKLKVEEDEAKLREQAKRHLAAGDERKAKLCMKLRKNRMVRLENVEGQLLNVYEVTQSIEWQSEQVSVFKAMQSGKDALNEVSFYCVSASWLGWICLQSSVVSLNLHTFSIPFFIASKRGQC